MKNYNLRHFDRFGFEYIAKEIKTFSDNKNIDEAKQNDLMSKKHKKSLPRFYLY